MPRLHHAGLDATIVRNDRQAAVLAGSGWAPIDADGSPVEPPRSGRGSGVDAWREFATAVGLELDGDATRDEIIAAWDAH